MFCPLALLSSIFQVGGIVRLTWEIHRERKAAVLTADATPNNCCAAIVAEEGISYGDLHKWRAQAPGKGSAFNRADAGPGRLDLARTKFAAGAGDGKPMKRSMVVRV